MLRPTQDRLPARCRTRRRAVATTFAALIGFSLLPSTAAHAFSLPPRPARPVAPISEHDRYRQVRVIVHDAVYRGELPRVEVPPFPPAP